jgi:hypothetical protein
VSTIPKVSETSVPAHIGLPEENPDWMMLYAHKCKEFDRATNQIVQRELLLRKIEELYVMWAEQARNPNTFAPDDQVSHAANCGCFECVEATFWAAKEFARMLTLEQLQGVSPRSSEWIARHFGLKRADAEPRKTMATRIGKSAGGEMHLSASGYCSQCNMLVELGTDDCPHAIGMKRKAGAGAKEPG